MGFFSYFRDYIRDFSEIARPLTTLTQKRFNKQIPWGETEQQSLNMLKSKLIAATEQPLHAIQLGKPFSIHVDASGYAIGAMLTQTDEQGREQPVCFASAKFNSTQERWSTIEKEAYAVLWALGKFRHWILGTQVTVYSDHNPLSYLTESVTKSAKLLRWSLALQEYDICFKFKPGAQQIPADCLSRNVIGIG